MKGHSHRRLSVIMAVSGCCMAVICAAATADPGPKPPIAPDGASLRRALDQAFPIADAGWRERLVPDQTLVECAAWHNKPPKDVATAIRARETARIAYPDGESFIGDWRRGEAIAQSGYGLRFSDKTAGRENGGNCYACHQLSPEEDSFGTVGISLKGYGRTKNADNPEDQRSVYDKIFNSQAAVACSLMPRFGTNGILTKEQIKDLVALLLDPDSPVNRQQPAANAEQRGPTR